MSEEKKIMKKTTIKIKHLEKLNIQQGAVNISNQPNPRNDKKKTFIAIDNYNNTLNTQQDAVNISNQPNPRTDKKKKTSLLLIIIRIH